MNRLTALITLLFVTATATFGQKPDTVSAATVVLRADTAIENRLVELALKSPFYSASVHQIHITELQLKSTKNSWLNLLSISTSVNDQTLKKAEPGVANTYVYPKYNIGVTIPLGIIFSQGNNVKTAKETLALNKDQQEQLARTIKADIIGKYKQYRNYDRLMFIQSQLVTSVVAAASTAATEFDQGKITRDVYLKVMTTQGEELAKSINLKNSQDQVKLEIEKIIGIPLEQVLYPTPPTK